jgi:protein TonB
LPKVKLGDIIPLDSADTPPVAVKIVDPVFPSLAMNLGVEGTVLVNALISENGDVIQAAIVKGIKGSYGFEEVSQNAVRKWKFKPATKDGINVRVWKTIAINFKK